MGHDTMAVPPKLSVAESDSYFVAVQADIYGVTRVDTTVDDTTYTILTMPEYGYTTEVGKPMVPVVTADRGNRSLVSCPCQHRQFGFFA